MTQPKLNRLCLIAAVFATATWGMTGIFVRWLPGWSPFTILAGRFLIATVAMLPILFLQFSVRQNLSKSLRTPNIWLLSLLAIGCYILGTTSFQLAPVGEVTLLFTTSPLFIIAYKYVARLPIKQSEGLGMLLATGGVVFIALPQLSATDKAVSWQTIAGYLLALSAAGLMALYTLWFNKLSEQNIAPKSLDVVFVTCLLGFILSYFCTIFLSGSSVEIGFDKRAILTLLALGIFSTALPFLCYTVAAQSLPVIVTTAILLLEPIFAVLFASVALQEIPSLWFGIGGVLVFWGLLSIASQSSD